MEQITSSEVRGRGEITIPKKIRIDCHLEEGQRVEFIPIGSNAVLLTPKRLELEEARRLIRDILKDTQASPEEVLKGLEASREEIFKKHYDR